MAETITVRMPSTLKRAVLRACTARGYTLSGFVIRALEDAIASGIETARGFVGRGEIRIYAPRTSASRKKHGGSER